MMYSYETANIFFKDLFANIPLHKPNKHCGIVMVCHVMDDLEMLVDAVNQLLPIRLILAIPYSTNSSILRKISKKYKTLTPTLEEMVDHNIIFTIFKNNIKSSEYILINDIGGYFAPILTDINNYLGDKLIGIVEDTELGHRRYETINNIPCPFLSVARSSLKEKEDFIVGKRCVSASLNILREYGNFNNKDICLVMGYGKIGRAVAHELKNYGFYNIHVYDCDPIKRLQAYVEGFSINDKKESLSLAKFIFGTTGNFSITKNDFQNLNDEAYLISCSSKVVEFDLEYLRSNYTHLPMNDYMDKYSLNKKNIILFARGQPVNLNFGPFQSLVGDIIALIHAEIILAINHILINHKNLPNGLSELTTSDKQMIAALWIKYFARDRKS